MDLDYVKEQAFCEHVWTEDGCFIKYNLAGALDYDKFSRNFYKWEFFLAFQNTKGHLKKDLSIEEMISPLGTQEAVLMRT